MVTTIELSNVGGMMGVNSNLTIKNGPSSLAIAGTLMDEIPLPGNEHLLSYKRFYALGWIEFVRFPAEFINQGPIELEKFEPRLKPFFVKLLAGQNPISEEVKAIYKRFPDLQPSQS
jgi:hypothetical protein